ncbi:class I SAM-dependent methyltransferase [Actinomycetospora corticicola]|uniref:SAM-dependent methyltransferase n=1 Tax=Actinomycetospora corticicola TaxID=663602 RepID=A0A7Y9DV88_9PSEU|nr:SAM-dependent methyltransferase [Actinomycetospora corticicola]
MEDDRSVRRTTFDEDALLYDRARPTYPEDLFDAIDRRLPADRPRTLEIGCGTGQATVSLAQRGHRVLAVELGAALAEVARRNLARFPQVEVVTADVERWELEEADFDLVVCATAFHWLDPATRFARVARLLRHGGLLALVQTIHVAGSSAAFFTEVQQCYARWDPATPPDLRIPALGDLPPASAYGLEDAEEFDAAETRRFGVDLSYDAARYLDLLATFSNHRSLPTAQREGLFACLRRRIAREPGGTVVRSVAFELSTAFRRPG